MKWCLHTERCVIGFIAPSLIQKAQLQEAAGSLQGVLFANNGETRGNAVKNYKKTWVVIYLKASPGDLHQ